MAAKTTYVRTRRTNRMVTEEERAERRTVLAARDAQRQRYIKALRERVRKQEASDGQ